MVSLQDDFLPAIFRDGIGCGAIVETHDIPSRSDHIATCFLELERLNQELKSKLRDDFVNILNDISNISLNSTPKSPSPSLTPPSRPSSLTHASSFVSEAYSWLLENITNPYPSPTIKTSLAQRHSCSISAVSSWFVNVRRRIGWTPLCRAHFGTCRADALDAAYRALVKEDPNRPLSPDIIHAFIGVKVAAEELNSSISTRSAFADDLAKDIPDQEGLPVNKRKHSGQEGITELPKACSTTPQIQNCYSSPDHSPISSSVPALDVFLTDESEPDDGILPPTLAGRKRRFSSEGSHTPMSKSTPRPTKRLRSNHCVSVANPRLPPPATSADECSENAQIQRVGQGLTSSGPHKQCPSDMDTLGLLKHPHDSMTEPRSVLGPLSALESERAIDEWFKTNFENLFSLPPPVEVTQPDLSAQWEVELFNNYSIPEGPQKPLTPSTQDNQTEDILQSLESGGFVGPPYTMHLPLVPDPVAEDFSLLQDPLQPIDWAVLLNGDPEPANTPLFSHSHSYVNSTLSGIDLSILQLPQLWGTVAS